MPTTLTAKFETRREADMTIERLVQEHGIERTDIFVTTDGADNSVGTTEAGSDVDRRQGTSQADEAPLHGTISVSVDIEDDARADQVRSAFAEFDATATKES